MTKKNRLIALLLAVTVIFAVLFSALFIAQNADHNCIGDDCQICYAISVCENVLKTIGSALAVVILAALVGVFRFFLPSVSKRTAYRTSLVTLKVKLSN